jgi:xanthine dehydrogenase accessory factor
LPFAVSWIDTRTNAFPSVAPQNVAMFETADPASHLELAPDGTLAFVMSHSHALDFAIVDAALRNQNILRIGLIGSLTKRARFESRLRQAGIEDQHLAKLICPIGIDGIRSKRPSSIAASVVAQVLQLDEVLSLAVPSVMRKAG